MGDHDAKLATAPTWSAHARHRRMKATIAALLCALAIPVVATPAPVSAGQNDIYAGWLASSPGAYGPRHSLNSVWATWYDGFNSCLNAWNDEDVPFAVELGGGGPVINERA